MPELQGGIEGVQETANEGGAANAEAARPRAIGTDGPPISGLATTPAYDLLLRRAAWLGRGSDQSPLVSFTSLFLSMFAAHDELSLWVQDKASWIGPAQADVARQWSHKGAALNEARMREVQATADADLPASALSPTSSARHTLSAARDLAGRVGSDTVDVHHVFAAYLYTPSGHDHDLKAWKLDCEAWATRLRCYLAIRFPDQAERWRALHEHIFPCPASSGITEAVQWASALAQRTGAKEINARLLLMGVLSDGLAYSKENVASAQLIRLLGGESVVEHLMGTTSSHRQRASEVLPFSEEARVILDRALVFATASTTSRKDGNKLRIRHLLAALFTDRRPLSAFEIVRRADRTNEGVLAQLCRWIYAYPGSTDNPQRWRNMFAELRESVVAGYDNDEAQGDDCLSIGPDVRALAAVIASTRVHPPLSIGLFGNWGSGKSFFMAKLRERVAQLAAAAKAKPTGESWFCGQRGSVVQIDFNAWHYMDANLWSSLAVRVFDALNDDLKQEFAKACVTELGALGDRETELATEHAGLVATAAALDEEVQRQRTEREHRELTLTQYVEGVARAAATKVAANPDVREVTERLALQGDQAFRDLARVKDDLGTVVGQVKRYWHTLRTPKRLLAFAMIVATPILVSAVAAHMDIATNAAATIGAFLTALGGLYGWASRFAAHVDRHLRPALDEIDRVEAEARAQTTAAERRGQAERDETTARITELEKTQLEVDKRQGVLVDQLTALQNGDQRSFKDFILQRTAADDYRKHLGVVSSIHQDFQQLVAFLKPNDRPPNVERIILYIDDLDRCPPARVVEVLQAIHIILSLPLFVVVVGVDSRWLLDSLRTYYRQQFPMEGVSIDAARPQQYLEKIFQIPFTLSPMSSAGYDALVGSLLRTQPEEDKPVELAIEPGSRGTRQRTVSHALASSDAGAAEDAVRDAASARVDLTPRGLQLEPRERDYMKQLAALVSSPRATKRLVNLYRIVRCSLDDDALDQLIEGRYKIVQICLALVIGSPSFGAELFSRILSGKIRAGAGVVSWHNSAKAAPDSESAETLATLGALVRQIAEFADWEAVQDAVRRVARFSFETGRVLGVRPGDPVHAPAADAGLS